MTKRSPKDDAQTFNSLGIKQNLCEALQANGIITPFPIQQLAIPIALSGADLIGQAHTGTGKTLAFGLPVLQRIVLPDHDDFDQFAFYGSPQALVITPTRELALQITAELSATAAQTKARLVSIYGGVSYDEQIEAIRSGVDIVVGTPGRLVDLVNRDALDLSHVEILVLDEADEMLDLGFLADVDNLISNSSSSRQTLMFSATMPSQILSLARSHMNQPVHVRAETNSTQITVADTVQYVYQAHELDKPEMLGKLLQSSSMRKAMIFTRTKRSAQNLSDELYDRGFEAKAIHGDLNQHQRERTLKQFRRGQINVLVCTDVAARGIDVAEVTHVINYEVPDDPKQYVHRIGRTGRAGSKGIAVTLVDWQDVTRWNVINRELNLDFQNPPETYSTSNNFLIDLQISADVKGWIARSDRRKSHSKAKHFKNNSTKPKIDSSSAPRDPKPRRKRRRIKNGKVIREGEINLEDSETN